MEDWESFFEEKSRRRADKVRRRHAIRMLRRLVLGALVLAALVIFLMLRG